MVKRKRPWKIYDWAGNAIDPHQSFKSFEDAWDYILGPLTDRLGLTEEDYQEYFAEKREPRAMNYLQANDIRMRQP